MTHIYHRIKFYHKFTNCQAITGIVIICNYLVIICALKIEKSKRTAEGVAVLLLFFEGCFEEGRAMFSSYKTQMKQFRIKRCGSLLNCLYYTAYVFKLCVIFMNFP